MKSEHSGMQLVSDSVRVNSGQRCSACLTDRFDGYCQCSRETRYHVVSVEIDYWLQQMRETLPPREYENLALRAGRSSHLRARRHAGVSALLEPGTHDTTVDAQHRRSFEGRHVVKQREPRWTPETVHEADKFPL